MGMNILRFIQAFNALMRRIRRARFILLAKLTNRQVIIGGGLNVDHGFKLYANGNKFSVKVGINIGVRRNFSLMISDFAKVAIGNNTFFNNGCSISCHKSISIGDDCLFGENVKMYDHNHKFEVGFGLFRLQGFNDGQITIGNNVWVGSNVTILKDVTIGDNVVIGANCLVYKNIESNAVVKHKEELIVESFGLRRSGAGPQGSGPENKETPL